MAPAKQDRTLTVRVLFFGAARDAVGQEEVNLNLNPPVNAASSLQELISNYPNLQRFGRSLLLAVNQEYALPDKEIRDGDELAIFPPVSGGSHAGSADTLSAERSSHDFFELTTAIIDVGK